MALVLANPSADRLQSFSEGTGGFPFSFTGVDLDAACRDKRQRCVVVTSGPDFKSLLPLQPPACSCVL